jgi:hypothetical protein
MEWTLQGLDLSIAHYRIQSEMLAAPEGAQCLHIPDASLPAAQMRAGWAHAIDIPSSSPRSLLLFLRLAKFFRKPEQIMKETPKSYGVLGNQTMKRKPWWQEREVQLSTLACFFWIIGRLFG